VSFFPFITVSNGDAISTISPNSTAAGVRLLPLAAVSDSLSVVVVVVVVRVRVVVVVVVDVVVARGVSSRFFRAVRVTCGESSFFLLGETEGIDGGGGVDV